MLDEDQGVVLYRSPSIKVSVISTRHGGFGGQDLNQKQVGMDI